MLLTVSAMLAISLLLSGCSTTPKDETAQWSAEKLYAEAKEEASSGNYDRAGKLYEASKAAPPAPCWRSRRSSSAPT